MELDKGNKEHLETRVFPSNTIHLPLTYTNNIARRLQETGLFSDFTITCKGHTFKVHKTVLYTQSEYFRKLLTGPFKVTIFSSRSL